ncbi:MAG TPA: ChbG/HpnK family deacetylase, partial [Thermoanaerobaculia bacterium]|nr:ChbG/HpnK family deacetylase [Thermoanaerobaculia bacterium]
MKTLIVTADDVGLHRGMTDGAIHAHLHGIVTACSVVANGAAFEHAVERLQSTPTLEVGVHLTLVEERPLADDVPSLVGANDLLLENWAQFVPRYFARLIRMRDVERELRAQLSRVLDAGLRVTHLNGHQHLHLLPRVFAIVERLADEYGVG